MGAWQVTWRCGRSGDDSLLTEHLLGARCPITDEMGAMPAHFTGEETEALRKNVVLMVAQQVSGEAGICPQACP